MKSVLNFSNFPMCTVRENKVNNAVTLGAQLRKFGEITNSSPKLLP